MANGKAAEKLETVDVVVKIPLGQILVRKDWNARSEKTYGVLDQKSSEAAEKSETGQSFAGLVQDIKLHGVLDPAEVMANPDKATARKQPYLLVTGFRRYAASEIAGFDSLPCIVREFTSEYEARVRNLNENVNREGLRGADLAYGIAKLYEIDPKATEMKMAGEVGINQSYLNKLKRIMQNLPSYMTEAWRGAQKDIKVLDMYRLVQLHDAVKAKKKDEKELKTAWEELVTKITVSAGANGGPSGPKVPADKLAGILKKAEELGRQLGIMVNLGAIEVNEDSETWEKVAIKILGVPADKTTAEAMRKITGALAKGYENAHEEETEDEAEETEEAEEVTPEEEVGKRRGRRATTV